jgi:hypothetical protein
LCTVLGELEDEPLSFKFHDLLLFAVCRNDAAYLHISVDRYRKVQAVVWANFIEA